jgi:peptidoglycan/LPS O-acetylase OafA/YrhL
MSPSHGKLTHPKYRPDIDGLRAVAVLAVVAYHAAPSLFPGGFVGVDIFFVISGFLISTIIFDNLRQGSFSFLTFYSRRIRRIFPALLVVLVACLTAGWFLLMTGEYQQLGAHIAGGAGFLSNFVLWRENGYFDNDATTKPLLHLWSLGIEEQFYILWPFLLWAAWRRKFAWLTVVILILAASFAWNIAQAATDPTADFYSPLTRFWELLAGALLAHGLSNGRQPSWSGVARQGAAWFGALLLTAGFALVNAGDHYPSAWALLPVVGAASIIGAGPQSWVNRRLLAHPVAVWFGLISYPLYLWHWPLLSFARIVESETPSWQIRAGMVAMSVILAWITLLAVERPLRFADRTFFKTALLAVLMICVGSAGYAVARLDGIASRPIVQEAQALDAYSRPWGGLTQEQYWQHGCFSLTAPVDFFARNGCEGSNPSAVKKAFIIGDSFSAYLSLGLRPALAAKGYDIFQYSTAYCTPLSLRDRRARCDDINRHVFDMVKREQPDLIVLFADYLQYEGAADNGERMPIDQHILQVTQSLAGQSHARIILIGARPTWQEGLVHILQRRFVLRGRPVPERSLEEIAPASLELDQRMRSHSYPPTVSYVSLRDFLCNAQGCLIKVGPDLKTDLISIDYGHLTKPGADFVTTDLLSPFIEGVNLKAKYNP